MVRLVDGVRFAVGAGALAAPGGAAQRVLGARQLVQAVVTARTGWRTLGAGVDVLHGLTMLPLLASGRTRRFAAGQIVTAALLVLLELRAER